VQALAGWGVDDRGGRRAAVEVLADAVVLESGRRVAADIVIGAAGAAPQGWLTRRRGSTCTTGS
jgi:hypothetical protein